MAVLMGPVLALLDARPDSWDLGVLIVSDSKPPNLNWTREAEQGTSQGIRLWAQGKRVAYSLRFTISLKVEASSFAYEIDGRSFQVALPGHGEPPRFAYASCNGFSDPKLMKSVDDNNRMWAVLAARHVATPLNLLLMGGDQVYADEIWRVIPELRAFAEATYAEADAMPCPPKLAKAIEAFYFDLYVQRWSQPQVAAMLAVIPTIMMWDDHDIIDGWGSYPPARQNSPIFQEGIGPGAAKAFWSMQKQQSADQPPTGFLSPGSLSKGYVIGRIAFLAIDMRSERTIAQVLSPSHWNAIFNWMVGLTNLDHLIVMSSIPVIYPSLSLLQQFLVALPGYQDLEDDLRDRWNSPGHQVERLRLVQRLLSFATDTSTVPTILSGDVHLAGLGSIESRLHKDALGNPLILFELISSAIVHPGPGATVLFALNHLLNTDDELETGIIGRNTTYPTSQQKFIGARNFLTIEPDLDRTRPRLWANLWIENGANAPKMLTKVINPMPLVGPAAQVIA